MNREEAAREIDNTACCFSDKRFRDAMHMAAAALRGPQPDPITGLMPCGCGGKAEYYYHPIEDWVAVECVECGAGTSYKDTKEQARDAWNLSHSYREGTAE